MPTKSSSGDLSIISLIVLIPLASLPFIFLPLTEYSCLPDKYPKPIVPGAVTVPAKPSSNISSPLNSCPAANIPAASPVAPPTASTNVPFTAAPAIARLVPPIALAPILPAIPPVNASIAPIAIPLPKALLLILNIASSSSKTFLISSFLLKSKPLSLSSSCSNSAKVPVVSIAVIAAVDAPTNVPAAIPAPSPAAPAAAPVAAPAATSPGASRAVLTIPTPEDKITSGPIVGFCNKALKPAKNPLSPSFLYFSTSC